MAWIKRNLLFLTGSLVAVAALAGAGLYLFGNYQLREKNKQKLTASYEMLDRYCTMSPGPGDGKKMDNIKAAKNYKQALRELIQRSGKYFQPIAPIPNSPQVSAAEFAAQLRETIRLMQRDAAAASVLLPPQYDFAFSGIKKRITFAPGSLQPLSVQLGEVKAICDVLFATKINSLDGIRRERVSPDDVEMADYIEDRSLTNELAILAPYEVTLHCFSGELASLLDGFAASPHGFIVSRLMVEPAGSFGAATDPNAPASGVTGGQVFAPTGTPAYPRRDSEDIMLREQQMMREQARAAAPVVTVAPVVTLRGGQAIVLNERLLKVSLRLVLVKRLEAAQ
jgi:hypothetical protein